MGSQHQYIFQESKAVDERSQIMKSYLCVHDCTS